MKRDLDLARKLLLRLEAQHVPAGAAVFLSVLEPPLLEPGESPDDVHYTMKLLADAGFLDLTKAQGGDSFGLRGLSWRGHDFLDSVRDDALWRKTKDGALAAGGWTFGLLCDLAKGFAKKQIEDRTGSYRAE